MSKPANSPESRGTPPAFPDVMTVQLLQKHVDDSCKYFGWDVNSDEKSFLLFMEEMGELAKALRRKNKFYNESGKTHSDEAVQNNLAEELADCLNYLVDIANRHNVDLEKAYRDKMTQNFTRTWS